MSESELKKVYSLSVKHERQRMKKALDENKMCYESLINKESDYAKAVKALGDLREKAYSVYRDAPSTI